MRHLPDLLAHRVGRLAAFFLLYVTEGLPLGFTATAVTTQMRRADIGPAEIGMFVGTLYLPWAWKWMAGPVVDLVHSDRLGRRRAWIVAAQCLMAVALISTVGVDFTVRLKLFVALIFIVNTFGALQDVAIDALAVGVLEERERGLANGLMFAGAYTGQALGGAGVLFLSRVVPFQWTYFVVAGLILSVTVFVALPMREPPGPERRAREGSVFGAIAGDLSSYVVAALRAIFGSRGALLAAVFALLPCGAYSLSLALQSNLAVELGLTDTKIATLALITTLTSAAACVIGGLLSDRLGRRRMLAIYVALTAVPTLLFAWLMFREGYMMPVDPSDADPSSISSLLVAGFWVACIVYAVFHGLMYGTRTALFMDVCDPLVAATQFTAYMAMLNLVISYSSAWQGWAIERFGYPMTLAADGLVGLACLVLLPGIRKRVSCDAA